METSIINSVFETDTHISIGSHGTHLSRLEAMVLEIRRAKKWATWAYFWACLLRASVTAVTQIRGQHTVAGSPSTSRPHHVSWIHLHRESDFGSVSYLVDYSPHSRIYLVLYMTITGDHSK